MANEKNLRPLNTRAKRVQRRIQSAGGKARAEKCQKLKTLAEELRALLSVDIVDLKGRKMNTQTAISTALINAAIHGDVKAFNAIRDTLGQKPTEKVETNVSLTSNWETTCKRSKNK